MALGFTHESTASDVPVEWFTPPELFEALGETFDLDPCSPGAGKSFVPARHHYTIEDDGLASAWDAPHISRAPGFPPFVFMNPPYGKQTAVWMEKLAEHGNGIALVFARTSPAWFQTFAPKASALCFVSGRIRFYRGNLHDRPGAPGADSVLIAYGERGAKALINSGLGVCVTPLPTRALAAAA